MSGVTVGMPLTVQVPEGRTDVLATGAGDTPPPPLSPAAEAAGAGMPEPTESWRASDSCDGKDGMATGVADEGTGGNAALPPDKEPLLTSGGTTEAAGAAGVAEAAGATGVVGAAGVAAGVGITADAAVETPGRQLMPTGARLGVDAGATRPVR